MTISGGVSGSVPLSVVIPACNEAGTLPSTLPRIASYLLSGPAPEHEIIVVDDGSTDSTAAIAAAHAGVRLVRLPANRGKGAAVRAGVLASQGASVLITDADLSVPIEDMALLMPLLDRSPLVFGSRGSAGSHVAVRQPVYRETLGRLFNLLLRLKGVTAMRDTQCGFKLLRGHVARELFQHMQADGFAFDVELLLLARARGYDIAEAGVTWRHAEPSRVHMLRDPVLMIAELAAILRRQPPDND